MILEAKFEIIHNPSFANLNKFLRLSLLHEEVSEIEIINFIGCYATCPKDSVYAVTKIGVEFVIHNQIFIPVEALKRIQQSNLIIEMMI